MGLGPGSPMRLERVCRSSLLFVQDWSSRSLQLCASQVQVCTSAQVCSAVLLCTSAVNHLLETKNRGAHEVVRSGRAGCQAETDRTGRGQPVECRSLPR